MGQLTIYERGAVERARKILADIKADRSTPDYARHLGRLEVTARTLLTIIENLTADGEDEKGAARLCSSTPPLNLLMPSSCCCIMSPAPYRRCRIILWLNRRHNNRV
jgi:hypothetical protein